MSTYLSKKDFSNWFLLVVNAVVAIGMTPLIVSSLGLALYGAWSFVNTLINYMGLVDLGILVVLDVV